jgi:hypothetical protein
MFGRYIGSTAMSAGPQVMTPYLGGPTSRTLF